jgi:SecD/SecF fusion protein
MPGGPTTGGTMRRTFLTRTIICLIPTLLAAALVVNAYLKDPEHFSGFKRGIDLSGGTILVYEVDQDASRHIAGNDAQGTRGRAKADATLANALKRRIDPADLLGVVVRPIGESRVELILPYGSRTEGGGGINQNEVEKVKGLIREVGSLEFRIVANTSDDDRAIGDAQAYFDKAASNPEGDEAKALDAAARSGLSPPFLNKTQDDPDQYMVMNDPVQYAWVELGKNERADMGLSSVNPHAGRHGLDLSQAFASARRTNKLVYHGSNVYWSRESRNEKDPAESALKKFDYFVLTRVSDKDRVLVGGDITITAFVDQGRTGEPVIGFTFNSRGADRFYQMTSRNQPSGPESGGRVFRQLGIILDGYLISSANINEPIRARGQISGSFDRPYVERIVTLLRSGALPATLKPLPVSENTIGPTLGADTIRSGTRAVGVAYLAILVFMVIYYRFAGFVATVALLANLLLTIGFMVAVNASFTLPGMAGLVLMLGMAVDANVLIYERVREERDRGMNLPTALRNGYDRAFGTIIDTHLTSIFTAIVLYAVGNDQLKGFGVSLAVGLVISLFTSLYMTRLLFDFWQAKNWLTKLRMMRFFSRPSINFMRLRHYMFALTGFLTLAGLGLFLARGKQGLNVDFVGGTAYSGHLVEPLEIGALRKLVDEDRQKQILRVARVEEVVDPSGKSKNVFKITYEDGQETSVALANTPDGSTPEERADAVKKRASFLPDASVEQIFTGGSTEMTSTLFTIRTTERERELVEAMINRLFRDDQGRDLLVKNSVTDKKPDAAGDWTLTFKEPVSKSQIRTLLEREFQVRMGDQYPAADVFDVVELGEETEGRHKEVKIRVLKDANSAIQNLVAANQVGEVIDAVARGLAQRPQPERLETFDGTLASETQNRALYAILTSWLAILLYLWFRFGSWTFGTAAILCLVHDLSFTLGAIAVSHYLHDTIVGKALLLQDFKIDLPAVAALLTLVGYSVNEIIVNFARIREVRGKNPILTADVINLSVNQTLSRTILTSTTVFLVSLVLYAFGGEGIHLFAFVMMMGVLISTYSSIYIASPLLLILGEGRVKRHGPQPVVETAAQPA